MNSCVIETLDAAFHRFAQLGVCDLKAFDSAEGPQVVYLKCTPDKKQEVERYYNMLESMSSCANSPEKQRILEVEIQQAVKLSTS